MHTATNGFLRLLLVFSTGCSGSQPGIDAPQPDLPSKLDVWVKDVPPPLDVMPADTKPDSHVLKIAA